MKSAVGRGGSSLQRGTVLYNLIIISTTINTFIKVKIRMTMILMFAPFFLTQASETSISYQPILSGVAGHRKREVNASTQASVRLSVSFNIDVTISFVPSL